ncbi:MAG: helix-turn-helix domain-containing protein [Promethearchaeia archaeon]
MKEDFVQARIEIEIPASKWLSQFNQEFPDLNIEIISKFLLEDNIVNTLIEVQGSNISSFLDNLKKMKKPLNFQILFKEIDMVILNVKVKDPWILTALVETELFVEYPILVKEGHLYIETISERTIIDDFLKNLEVKGIDFTLKSVGYYRRNPILTKKQQELVKLAYKEGFYQIPRNISMKDIADQLNISRSAVSEMLRRINRSLVENYLNIR